MKRLDETNEEFRKYREQMHGVEDDDTRDQMGNNKTMRTVFAIIMIVVYIGVGILLLINFFHWNENIAWMRWFIGIVLILYGFFRSYRKYKGID